MVSIHTTPQQSKKDRSWQGLNEQRIHALFIGHNHPCPCVPFVFVRFANLASPSGQHQVLTVVIPRYSNATLNASLFQPPLQILQIWRVCFMWPSPITWRDTWRPPPWCTSHMIIHSPFASSFDMRKFLFACRLTARGLLRLFFFLLCFQMLARFVAR